MTEQEESNKAQTPYDQHEAGFIADAPSAKRVGFGTRLGAYILDIIIGGALGGLIGMFTGLEFAKALLGEASVEESMNMLSDYSGMLAMVFGAIAGMTLMFLFFILMESLLGQSPGKIILGIKIGNQDGTHASTGSLFARAFFKILRHDYEPSRWNQRHRHTFFRWFFWRFHHLHRFLLRAERKQAHFS